MQLLIDRKAKELLINKTLVKVNAKNVLVKHCLSAIPDIALE